MYANDGIQLITYSYLFKPFGNPKALSALINLLPISFAYTIMCSAVGLFYINIYIFPKNVILLITIMIIWLTAK